MAAGGNNVAGVHKFQQGQYQLALNDFQRALQNDPNNADAHYNLASVYHRLGKANGDRQMLEQAENLYNDCLNKCDATGGDHLECRRGLAVLLVEMDNADAAFRMLKNWSVEHPESAEPLVELARLYEEFGDKETARRQLEAAVQRDTTNARHSLRWVGCTNRRAIPPRRWPTINGRCKRTVSKRASRSVLRCCKTI